MPRIIKFFVFEQNWVTFDPKAKKFGWRVPVGRGSRRRSSITVEYRKQVGWRVPVGLGSRSGSSMTDEYRKQTWVTFASVAEKIDGRVPVLVGRGSTRR